MEGIAPTLKLLLVVKRGLEKGEPIRESIIRFLKSEKASSELSKTVQNWLICIEQSQNSDVIYHKIKSVARKSLLQVLHKGLQGHSIYALVTQMEEELVEQCRTELDEHVAKLPFKLMLPLLLFQFPALLILLFGSLLQQFIQSLGGL